jgi:hypothetical protein
MPGAAHLKICDDGKSFATVCSYRLQLFRRRIFRDRGR